mmetsp:Transcript_8264/g.15570  ORF Transcript_8264/g.15570 Transcript_8264/m.15570 type:complete len:1619 (-) Transcript_8264:17-4873(-)
MMEAARHISEEARILLTSLRTGPPDIAHGTLVQNLINLRHSVKQQDPSSSSSSSSSTLKKQCCYVLPFLDVIRDPRAAGPHTLTALRSLYRLLDRKSVQLSNQDEGYSVAMSNLMEGVLACRFEQTDVGNDEAVEMAIADLLSLVIGLDEQREMDPVIIMEGFNTVFVTRNTFVHSPALCYHFEEVLGAFVRHLFGSIHVGKSAAACRMILDFLVNQLLHTPMNLEDGNMSGSELMASALHDATRILSLRLIQSSLRFAWETVNDDNDDNNKSTCKIDLVAHDKGPILKIIQDNLCLSILMVGQGIWAYQDPTTDAVPGMISIRVLSEICSTVSVLWSLPQLRSQLKLQFENIFSGFYQRALALLRRLPVPIDSGTFHANQIFDTEVEIILESLVDLLYLHDKSNDGCALGTFETLFATFDCDLLRSDIATSLVVELSRCCGGNIDEYGQTMPLDRPAGMSRFSSTVSESSLPNTPTRDSIRTNLSVSSASFNMISEDETQLRHVPAHLRELCAEALLGITKSLFAVPSKPSEDVTEKMRNAILLELEDVKKRKRLTRQATELFNQKPSSGIAFLMEYGIVTMPVTPKSVVKFLRNGIVLGLDKRKVGEYLGEAGKSPQAGKSPPDWERDWFHKETLKEYCASFHFKGQALLDCLRMFLTSFRLPGEAQQIDRILQAFAESAALQCLESKDLFSSDAKKASDAAYLLSFSIIMLNTDLHNRNIRPDRKMKVEDFIKNNTDYGRDIMDPDKTFPREFLAGIYQSIRDEEIRTMGEGADGVMTFERWKDILRGDDHRVPDLPTSCSDGMRQLIAENVWMPIFSAIRGFWSVPNDTALDRGNLNRSGMLGSQGARLGMDLSMSMLRGLRNLSRLDIFQDLFVRLCLCTGLIGDYMNDSVERTSSFVDSVERQSAVIVVIKICAECGDLIGLEGWKCVFALLFELRDLKLIVGDYSRKKRRSLLVETDEDFLRPDARREWEMCIVKECFEATFGKKSSKSKKSRKGGFFNALIFGPPSPASPINDNNPSASNEQTPHLKLSEHGKEELLLWDDSAPSDTEDEYPTINNHESLSLGSHFEKILIQENQTVNNGPVTVTGLETFDDTHVLQLSPRARVRKRLELVCEFSSILSETRFYDISDLKILVTALIDLIHGTVVMIGHSRVPIILSPASEALSEVWLCEITLKNRDRIGTIWEPMLKDHYMTKLIGKEGDLFTKPVVSIIPALEKRVTGLLRICYHNIHRKDVNNQLLETLECLYTPDGVVQSLSDTNLNLNKQISEGLWRICRDVDALNLIDNQGWDVLLGLIQYCASHGEKLNVTKGGRVGVLCDDDPALQAFRCIHLMLRSNELRDAVPFRIVHSIRTLIKSGEQNNCPKLSIAGLDLLSLLHARLQSLISRSSENKNDDDIVFWANCWLSIVEGMAEASNSKYSNTRHHSISMFTDSLVDRHGQNIPIADLCRLLNAVCLPMAQSRMSELTENETSMSFENDEVMIELELCISAIFKPFLHYLRRLSANPKDLETVWLSMISVVSHLLNQETQHNTANNKSNKISLEQLNATKHLAAEHLRNAITILISKGIIAREAKYADDISSLTWTAIDRVPYLEKYSKDWKDSATLQADGK